MRRSMTDEEYHKWKDSLPRCGRPVVLHDALGRPHHTPCGQPPEHKGPCSMVYDDIGDPWHIA